MAKKMAVALLFPNGFLTSFLGTAIPENLVKNTSRS